MRNILLIALLLLAMAASAGTIKLQNGKNETNVLYSDILELNVNFSFTEIDFFEVNTKEGIFNEISFAEGTSSKRIGEPKLPVLRKLFAVPFGAEVQFDATGFDETEYLLAEYGIENLLMPAQHPVPKSANPDKLEFVMNAAVYAVNRFNTHPLVSVEEVGSLRGVRIFALVLEPIKYNPVAGTIRVFNNVNVQLDFIGADLAATEYLRAKARSHYFNTLYSNSLLNYETVISRDQLTRYPVKYVIVSDPMFAAQLQPFIEWKTAKGFEVITGFTNDPNIGSTTASIKAFLQNLYDAGTPEDPAPSFVLFVGDVGQIPAWSGSTGSHVTDLNYVKLDGTNFIPDMYYGRFSANNPGELQPQIDKTLMYEKYEMPDPSYLGEVVMIAGMDPSHGSTYGNGQINYGTENYFNAAHGILSHTYLYPQSGSSSTQIIQNVSNGVGYVNYTAHGSSTSWSDPSFTIANINSLQNFGKYPLAVGNCCQTNKFEVTTCFGEAWLRAENKGAIGYIGGTNNTYWDEDYWWGVGAGAVTANPTYASTGLGVYDGLFHDHGETFADWTTTTGAMIYRGNLAVTQGGGMINYYWEIYAVMGDPSLEAYLGMPQINTASYPNVLFMGLTSLQVTADPYSYVALSMNGEIYAAALTDNSGLVNLEFDAFQAPGIADIVITAQNRIPIIDQIEVIPNSGPYVIAQSFEIYDDNNNIPEYDETIGLHMTFENVGIEDALNVTANLSSDDPYVDITVAIAYLGDIASGSTFLLEEAFEMIVADNIPDQHTAAFSVEMTGSAAAWTTTIFITFNAPLLERGTLIVEDSGGDGNLDPGETATLIIPLTNIGNALSPEIVTLLSSANPDEITILNASFNLDPLAANESALAEFEVEVSDQVTPGTMISFFFYAGAGAYIVIETIYTPIGLIFEDFETGNFSAFNWQMGSYGWEVTSANPYEGVYCAVSSDIANSQTASLMVSMDVPADNQISFFRRVSSEANYDYLKFYINGVVQGEWAGEVPWGQVSFDVSAGTNVLFKWDYQKDYSVSTGSDCAWIDYIVFPGVGGSSGSPLIGIDVTELEFGSVALGETATQQFTISNSGDAALAGVILLPDCFTIDQNAQLTFFVSAGADLTFEVEFAPLEAIEYNEILTISSNDALQSNIGIALHGCGEGTSSNSDLIPGITALFGNYPNPFNPLTRISYGLSQDSRVSLIIYNIKGQKVKTLVHKVQEAGYHQAVWNGTDENNKNVGSGVYFYEFNTDNTDYTSVKKMLLLK